MSKSEGLLVFVIGVALSILSLLFPTVSPTTPWLESIVNIVLALIGIIMIAVGLVTLKISDS